MNNPRPLPCGVGIGHAERGGGGNGGVEVSPETLAKTARYG